MWSAQAKAEWICSSWRLEWGANTAPGSCTKARISASWPAIGGKLGLGGMAGGGEGQLAPGRMVTLVLGPTGGTLLGLMFEILPWWVTERADDPMSPLFPCCSCGVQIERSIKLYRQRKGKVLCSSCQDRAEALQAREMVRQDPGESGAPEGVKENS